MNISPSRQSYPTLKIEMERFMQNYHTIIKAYAGAGVTFLSQEVGTISPSDSMLHFASSYISIMVGILTSLYTITRLADWVEKKFFKKNPQQ